MTLTRHLTQLETSGLIRLAQIEPELEYLFRHELLYETAYASMLKSHRKKLHLAVGEALESVYAERVESRELAPLLAFHFSNGDDPQRALRYFALAGEAALASFANQEAEGYFRNTLDLSPTEAQRAQLLFGLGQSLFRQSRFEEALQVWREGIELCRRCGDFDGLARLYARSARAAWYGDVSESLKLCQEGLAAVEGAPDSADLARLVHEAAHAHFFNGLPEEARQLCDRALAMAERLGIADVQADALATMGMLYDDTPERALEALTRAVVLAEAHDLFYQAARAHTNLAYLLYSFISDLRSARDHDRRAAELSRRRGSVTGEVLSLGNVVHLSLLLGDFGEAEATLAMMHELLNEVDDAGNVVVHVRINDALLLRFRGELAEAVALLRESQDEARKRNHLEDLCSASTELANALLESCVLTGDLLPLSPPSADHPLLRAATLACLNPALRACESADEALEEAEAAAFEAVETSERAGWTSVQARCLLAMTWAFTGRLVYARELFAETQEKVSAKPTTFDRVLLLWTEAMLAAAAKRWPEALAAFESAAGVCASLGMRWWWARTLQAWAEALVLQGEPAGLERARALLREALILFEELDVPCYAALVESRLEVLRAQTYAWTLDQEGVARELALAARIQEGLLPSESPYIPGWQLAASLTPARETSGDFYDFIPLPGGRLGIVLADVADKGAGAALYMAMSRTLIRTYAFEHLDQPEQVLSVVNSRILADTDLTMFVTVFYGVLHPESGTLIYCNAGHNPPYLVKQKRGEVRELPRTGMAVGVLRDAPWEQRGVQIEPGDRLVLYTDGVTEAHDAQGVCFGEERLLAAIQTGSEGSAGVVQEALLAQLGDFVGDAPQLDDITVMIIVRA